MTTGMERIGALMAGQLPDRVPIFCNLLEQGAKELNMTIKEYYSKGEFIAEGQIKLQQKYGHDNVWAFPYTAILTELLGAKNVIYANDGPPNVGHILIRKHEDIKTLHIPENLEEIPAFQKWKKCIELIVAELKGKVAICSAAVCAFSLPAILMGQEQWFELLFFGDPSLRDELLEKCYLFNKRLIDVLRKSGVDLIAYSNAIGTADVISMEQFHNLCLPVVKKELDLIKTPGIVYFNGGGRINPHIEILVREIGITGFALNPFDDIAEAKQILRGKALIASGINDIGLINWSKEQISAEVSSIMKAGAPGGGFIFGTLVMPFLIPENNISYMIEKAKEYGQYDLYK